MTSYLYRVDRKAHLRNIKDGNFRAARWSNGSHDFPHAKLKLAAPFTPGGSGIYRICFYSSHERALQSLNTDYACWDDGVITRARLKEVIDLGFQQTWDDGFSEGEAYLFWRYDQGSPDDQHRSNSGIPVELLEISGASGWRPFNDALVPEKDSEVTHTSSTRAAPTPSKTLFSRLMSLLRLSR